MSDMWMVPWYCGDRDCPVGWHLAQYQYDDETGEPLIAKYGPGDPDWEPCDEEDLPTPEQEQAEWQAYYRHIARTGEDPCGELAVLTETTRTARFIVRFASWIGQSEYGVLFVGGRPASHDGRSAKFREADDLPEELRQFLDLEKLNTVWCCADAHSLPELDALAEKSEQCWNPHVLRKTGHLQFEVKVDLVHPRAEGILKRERKTRAREWLAREKERKPTPNDKEIATL